MTDHNSIRFETEGLTAITSLSIIQDCARLLADVYHAGFQLGLLPHHQEALRMVEYLDHPIENQSEAQAALKNMSELVSEIIFSAALVDRSKVAELYDLAKHLQSFHRLFSNQDLQLGIRNALKSSLLMVHKDSMGMRIDLPGEAEHLTELHQEFHSFPYGVNGAVVWIPLTRIDEDEGTLCFYPRPHELPPIPYVGNPVEQARLLSLGRLQEAQKAGGLVIEAGSLGVPNLLDAEPGNCYMFSVVLPHESVPAKPQSTSARLTCQARFFDVSDPFLKWKASSGRLSDGLKQPIEGWKLWQEYNSV